jgi:hypothetical protein
MYPKLLEKISLLAILEIVSSAQLITTSLHNNSVGRSQHLPVSIKYMRSYFYYGTVYDSLWVDLTSIIKLTQQI